MADTDLKRRISDELLNFLWGAAVILFKGDKKFYAWMSFLTVLVLGAAGAVHVLLSEGFVVTNLRDQVSWGFLIANFTFLVGIAAAAVLLVIPAYLYNFKPIKHITVLGELLAFTAILTALTFIMFHMGRPDRFWHAIPGLGYLNWPQAMLSWDMLILNAYMGINVAIALYIGVYRYMGKEASTKIVIPLIIISIPMAIGVHTITAFVFNSMSGRPFWNASILAPRFLASAFASGPALMILIFLALRKVTDFDIEDSAISKLAEITAYAMAVNLLLMGAEIFKEYYSNTQHLAPMQYLYQGLHGHNSLVPWIWTALIFNTVAFIMFLIPRARENKNLLVAGCIMIFIGVWIEKGMGLIFPGFIPDSLGEIYEYMPSVIEIIMSIGFWALGALIYTILVRFAIAVDTGRFRSLSAKGK